METIKIDASISKVMDDDEQENEQEDNHEEIPTMTQHEQEDIIKDIMMAPNQPPIFSVLDLTDAERDHRRQTMKKIRLYMSNFSHLRPIDIENLETHQPNERLDYVIQDIEFQLSTKRSFEMPMMAYKLGVMGLEKTSCKMGLKTQGLALICTTNDDILDTAKELFIKYDASKEMCAEYRLAMSISMVMFSLHTQNTQNEKIENVKKSAKIDDTEPELINKTDNFDDL